ncbi:MAG: HypC/HybG/HupF family hydrogenase formation chaperone [Myxococcota bacterium]
MCLGIPGQVVKVPDPADALGVVDVGGVEREVNLSCVLGDSKDPNELIGAWVLVHVGFAMSRIDEAEAQKTLEVLQMMGEAQAELDAMKEGDRSVAQGGRS